MRIVLTHPYCFPYVRRGTERNIEGLSRYLHARGHDVITVSSSPDGPRNESGVNGYRILHGPNWHPVLGRLRIEPTHTFALACRTDLMRLEPDIVHSFYFFDALTAGLVKRRAGYRTVLQMNGAPIPDAFHRIFPPERWLIRQALQHSDARIVCSDFVGSLISHYYGRPTQSIVPGIDLDEFRLGQGPEDGVPTLLAIGNFDFAHKGIRVLMQAFVRLKQSCPECRLRLSGKLSQGLRGQLLANVPSAVQKDIEILGLGELKEVPGHYRDASLVVVPSVNEPSGTVMMEAWASGTPVVAANHGGLPEFMHQDVGLLYEPGLEAGESRNVEGLVDAMLAGLELSRSAGIRERCRTYADRFSWHSIGPRIEALYQDLLTQDLLTGEQ